MLRIIRKKKSNVKNFEKQINKKKGQKRWEFTFNHGVSERVSKKFLKPLIAAAASSRFPCQLEIRSISPTRPTADSFFNFLYFLKFLQSPAKSNEISCES